MRFYLYECPNPDCGRRTCRDDALEDYQFEQCDACGDMYGAENCIEDQRKDNATRQLTRIADALELVSECLTDAIARGRNGD